MIFSIVIGDGVYKVLWMLVFVFVFKGIIIVFIFGIKVNIYICNFILFEIEYLLMRIIF